MMAAFTPRTLYFCFSPHCAACAEAEPDFDQVVREKNLFALKLNVDAANPSPLTKKVKATPTYIVTENGQVVWVRSGSLKAKDLIRALERLE